MRIHIHIIHMIHVYIYIIMYCWCRSRVLLPDVDNSVRFGAWVLVPLHVAAHKNVFAIWGLCWSTIQYVCMSVCHVCNVV